MPGGNQGSYYLRRVRGPEATSWRASDPRWGLVWQTDREDSSHSCSVSSFPVQTEGTKHGMIEHNLGEVASDNAPRLPVL